MKILRTPPTYVILPILSLILGCLASAQVISVNIGASEAEVANPDNRDLTKIDEDETFGVAALDTVVGGWNNIGWHTENLLFDDGTASTVSVTVAFPNPPNSFGAGYADTPLRWGRPHYTGTNDENGTSLIFSNVADNFPEGYFIIVYMTGFKTNTGASVTNGRTTYYYRAAQDNTTQLTPETLLVATDTTEPAEGNFQEAHYAVFGSRDVPLSNASYEVKIDCLYGGGSSLNGVQIVSANHVGQPSGPSWTDFVYDENGWVDTGVWLGMVNVANAPWIHISGLDNWAYAPDAGLSEDGAWIYIPVK